MSLSREDKDMLAAQFAMGLLEPGETARVERMLIDDPEFAALHQMWRERLSEIDATAPAHPAGDALWGRISASLSADRARAVAPARLDAPGMAERLRSLWASLGFWRSAGLTAALASIVLTIGLGLMWREAARQPVLVAVLLTQANEPGAIVNVHADGRAELVPLGDIPVPPGRALQVWTLWDRARGPVSIGLSRSARRLPLDIKALPRTTPTQLFEITLEPENGSPTGRPTGPILMKGNATTAL